MTGPEGPWPECTRDAGIVYMTVPGRNTHGLHDHELMIIARPKGARQALEMHGGGYRSVCCPERDQDAQSCACLDKWIFLDLIVYFTEHLADFHKDWPAWLLMMWTGDHDEWFEQNPLWATMPSTFPDGIAVIAYAGQWLWARIHGDLMSAHGGGPDDFRVTFGWEPQLLNTVWPHVPGFAPPDPEGIPDEPV